MHLVIRKEDLVRAVTAVAKVVEARNVIEILSNLRLSAKDGELRVTACDLTIVAEAKTSAEVSAAGDICVDAKLFGDIARKATGDVTIIMDGDKLVVKSGRSRFSLRTLPAHEFPSFGKDSYAAEFTTDLSALVAPVAFAAGTNDIREMLNGVFLGVKNGALVAVATDGHRLARHCGEGAPAFDDIIIPNKAVGLLPKGRCVVSISPEKMRVVGDDIAITTKLIGMEYPDYERVIPLTNDKEVSTDRDEMMRAADRVVTVSNEKSKGVKLSIAPGSVQFSARSDAGNAEDEVAADYSGEPLEYGLNSQYLRDMLAAMPTGRVKFSLRDATSPARVTGQNDNWDGVVMPLRVA